MKSAAVVLSALAFVGIQAQGDAPSGAASPPPSTDAKGGAFGKGVPFGPAPTGCSAFEVLYARGTAEPGPFGVIVGDKLHEVIKKDMSSEDYRGYAVQYPASMAGADIGYNDVVNRITTKAKECPAMKFALVGYSQGGMVVSTAAAKLSEDLFREKVVAIVLYGSGTGAGGGKRGGAPPREDIKQKTLANCAPGDMCGNQVTDRQNAGPIGHLSYGSVGTVWHARSSQYIVDSFHGKAQGYKLALDPK